MAQIDSGCGTRPPGGRAFLVSEEWLAEWRAFALSAHRCCVPAPGPVRNRSLRDASQPLVPGRGGERACRAVSPAVWRAFSEWYGYDVEISVEG
jgi:hypothetical protein